MTRTAALILAAGLSQRFGTENKLLAPFGGKPVLRHVAEACAEATDVPVTIVTGHQADRIADALSGLPVRLVHNATFAAGQMGSLVLGLRSVLECEAVLVTPGDLPLLTAAHLRDLDRAHGDAAHQITIPVCDDKRGNPIVIPASLIPEILADPFNPGCRNYTRAHPERVHTVAMSDQAYFTDVDTPDALARAIEISAPGDGRGTSTRNAIRRLGNLFKPAQLTPEQAEILAHAKLPCC